jgi:hypothetical protein
MTTTHSVEQVTLTDRENAGLGWVRYAQCGSSRTVFPADTWFSSNPIDVAIATSECGRCPVREYCAKSPMATDLYAYGTWGGMFHPEHRDPTVRPECGTQAGVNAHKRTNELMCPACREVVNRTDRERKRGRRRKCKLAGCDNTPAGSTLYCSPECRHVATVGTPAGAHLHQELHEPSCPACRAMPGTRTTAAACLTTAA